MSQVVSLSSQLSPSCTSYLAQSQARRCFARVAGVSAAFALVGIANAGGLVLNEYNATGSTKYLGGPTATNDDKYFGRVLGNGGNWLEFVVTQDHLDLRGWKIRWAETLNLNVANGADLWYGNAQVDQGIITFSNDARWSDLRAGTIITIHEFSAAQAGAEAGKDNDATFDPCTGDWWISAHTFANPTLLTTQTNVAGNVAGNFSVGNDGWLCEIVNAAGVVVTARCGEGAPGYGGGGVASTEICRLEATPSVSTTSTSLYDDGDDSTCGRQNSWRDPLTACRLYQDLEPLRAAVRAELCTTCVPVILNEYNAVDTDGYLNGGTSKADIDGGFASDSYFGRVLGNGGNWFELVVIEDGLDMRGWTLEWSKRTGEAGALQLSADAAWGSLPAGTIITFTERTTKQGGLNTDLSLDIAGGDRWINVNSFDTSLVASTTSNIAGHVSGEFSTSNNRWAMTFKNASNAAVAGPFGEGAVGYYQGGIAATDVCRLKDNPGPRIDSNSAYDDSKDLSTFGAPNIATPCELGGAPIEQDFSGLPVKGCGAVGVPGDIDGNGTVDASDLAVVLANWGSTDAASDLNDDGTVDASDLALVLANWTA
ncbi:MAG: hypothetical protein RL591_334 [Planctomycetota bacterium]